MRCLLKFSTTPTSSHLSGTDSYLITISPLRRAGPGREEGEGDKGVARRRAELSVRSGTGEDCCRASTRTHAGTVAAVIVIATTLFLRSRVKDSRDFLRSYRLIRGFGDEGREIGSGTNSPGETAYVFNMSGSRWFFFLSSNAPHAINLM